MLGAGCEPASTGEAALGSAHFDVIGAGPVAWRLDEEFTVPGLSMPSPGVKAVSVGKNELLLGTTGAALLYTRESVGWTLTERWTTSDAFNSGTSGTFGSSVVISGDTALVGCPTCTPHGPDSGAVYVYARGAGSWSLQQVLTIEGEEGSDLLGTAVALDGDTALLASARGAHIFTRANGSFSELTTLETPSTATDVALKDDLAVIVCNAPQWTGPRVNPTDMPPVPTGAFVATRTGGAWSTPVQLPGTQTAAHAAAAFGHALVSTWDRSGGFPWDIHDGSWIEFSSTGNALRDHESGTLLAASSRGVLVGTSFLEQYGTEDLAPTNRSPALLWEPNGDVYNFAPFASANSAQTPALLAMSEDLIVFVLWDATVRVLVRYAEPELECVHDADCLSQHCVDGICCDSACNGDACQSCKAAEKGYGPDGVCDWIAPETQTSCGEPSCKWITPSSQIDSWAAATHQCRDRRGCFDTLVFCGKQQNSCESGVCVTPGAEAGGTGGVAGSSGVDAAGGEAPTAGSEAAAGATSESPGAGGDAPGPAQGGTASLAGTPVAGVTRKREKSNGGCNLPHQPATGGAEVALLLVAGLWRRSRAERAAARRPGRVASALRLS